MRPPPVLVLAGTDPLGGAGILADAFAITASGAWPLPVETAWVDQDSMGVHGFVPLDAGVFAQRASLAIADARPMVWKCGMLASLPIVGAVAELIRVHAPRWLVLDPVLRGGGADGGALAPDAMPRALRSLLGPGVLATPNVPELAALLNQAPALNPAQLQEQAAALHQQTGAAVLAKGGHLNEGCGTDVLVTANGVQVFAPLAWVHGNVHGTGCHLASAVAGLLAGDVALSEAVARARVWLAALPTAPLGRGRRQFVHRSVPGL